MDIDIKQGGGDASEATLAEIRNLLQKQKDFAESIWIDATDTFCIRRVVFDEDLQTYTVSYTLPNGSVYTPTAPLEPASSGSDREIVTQTYLAIASGTGYATGDIVTLSTIYDTNTASVLASIWWNVTSNSVISPAPSLANLRPEGVTQNIATAVGTVADSAYTSGNGTLVSILKGIFGKFGTLGQKNMAGSAPVVIASDQSAISVSEIDGLQASGSVTSATSIFSVENFPYRSVTVQVTSAGTTCTITYEVSNDNVIWFTTAGYDTSYTGAAAPVTTTTTTGIRQFHCGARYFRARVSTYGSGTVSAIAFFRNEPITRAGVFATIAAAGGIGSLTETAPASDTASSGLNGRLQRVAQNLTGLTTAPGTALGTLTLLRNGISDGINFVRLRGDSNGRLELSPTPIAPAATQSTVNFYVNAAVTVDQNSAATGTVPATGGRWISVTNNSGVVCDITTGGTPGGADGTTILTVIAGDSISMPIAIAASAVIRVKPRLAGLTVSDFVAVRIT